MSNPADCIYINAQIVTMDSSCPFAQAVATRKGRIVAVGAQDRTVSLKGKNTRILDLDGRTILPGFIDPHSHFLYAGLYDSFLVNLKSPPIGRIKNIDGLVAELGREASSMSGPGWILGYGYDDTLLEEKRHPEAKDLNMASRIHPILIRHVSGHLAVLNTAALKTIGVDRNTPDPPGGVIRREANAGEPNGILDGEPAMQLAKRFLPAWDEKHWMRAVERASEMYAEKGVTTAQEGDAQPGDLRNLLSAKEKGRLNVRVQLYPDWEHPGELSLYPGPVCGTAITEDRMLALGGVKMYQDGSLQGYSGYLSKPYHRQLYPQKEGESFRGRPRNSRAKLDADIEQAHREGWQIAVHANGDQAIQEVIDAMEAAQKRFPRRDPRHIIVHCQTVREDQLDRMRALGVIPSFFATHTYFWGDRHRDIFLGPERAARISPCRSAMDRGMPFTCHNDTSVTPIDPLRSIWSAVNRVTLRGRSIGPEYRVPVLEALRSVTSHAAYQNHEEELKGTLSPGKLADMTILDADPLEVDPMTIKDIEICATIVGDNIVYGSL
jgi:predicted amidohydrolase YtcJ